MTAENGALVAPFFYGNFSRCILSILQEKERRDDVSFSFSQNAYLLINAVPEQRFELIYESECQRYRKYRLLEINCAGTVDH